MVENCYSKSTRNEVLFMSCLVMITMPYLTDEKLRLRCVKFPSPVIPLTIEESA